MDREPSARPVEAEVTPRATEAGPSDLPSSASADGPPIAKLPPGPPAPPGVSEGASRPVVTPSVVELFRVFFVSGLTAFGMAILQSIRSVPVKRGWLAREEVDEGLGLVQTYPGAMLMDLVA